MVQNTVRPFRVDAGLKREADTLSKTTAGKATASSLAAAIARKQRQIQRREEPGSQFEPMARVGLARGFGRRDLDGDWRGLCVAHSGVWWGLAASTNGFVGAVVVMGFADAAHCGCRSVAAVFE